ncbi:MAG: hypothetical protein QM635_06720 [Microbacteriaceae bacterium]
MRELREPEEPDEIAPDGSEVRVLLATAVASTATFRLPAGAVSAAVRHHTITELWYVVAGRGLLWRADAEGERLTDLEPGVQLDIPPATAFQFRVGPDAELRVFGVTMPPWPGQSEAEPVPGHW